MIILFLQDRVNLARIMEGLQNGKVLYHICEASIQKGSDVEKIEIFVDLNRAGHDKSV